MARRSRAAKQQHGDDKYSASDVLVCSPRVIRSQQLRFLQVLQNYIAQNGGIEIERLYEPPFTNIHPESVDGVFTLSSDADDILAILSTFESKQLTG